MGLWNAAAVHPLPPGAHTLRCNLPPLPTKVGAPGKVLPATGSARFRVHLPETHPLRVHFLCQRKLVLPAFADESRYSQQVATSTEAEQDKGQQPADFGLNREIPNANDQGASADGVKYCSIHSSSIGKESRGSTYCAPASFAAIFFSAAAGCTRPTMVALGKC